MDEELTRNEDNKDTDISADIKIGVDSKEIEKATKMVCDLEKHLNNVKNNGLNAGSNVMKEIEKLVLTLREGSDESFKKLVNRNEKILKQLEKQGVTIKQGDGYYGTTMGNIKNYEEDKIKGFIKNKSSWDFTYTLIALNDCWDALLNNQIKSIQKGQKWAEAKYGNDAIERTQEFIKGYDDFLASFSTQFDIPISEIKDILKLQKQEIPGLVNSMGIYKEFKKGADIPSVLSDIINGSKMETYIKDELTKKFNLVSKKEEPKPQLDKVKPSDIFDQYGSTTSFKNVNPNLLKDLLKNEEAIEKYQKILDVYSKIGNIDDLSNMLFSSKMSSRADQFDLDQNMKDVTRLEDKILKSVYDFDSNPSPKGVKKLKEKLEELIQKYCYNALIGFNMSVEGLPLPDFVPTSELTDKYRDLILKEEEQEKINTRNRLADNRYDSLHNNKKYLNLPKEKIEEIHGLIDQLREGLISIKEYDKSVREVVARKEQVIKEIKEPPVSKPKNKYLTSKSRAEIPQAIHRGSKLSSVSKVSNPQTSISADVPLLDFNPLRDGVSLAEAIKGFNLINNGFEELRKKAGVLDASGLEKMEIKRAELEKRYLIWSSKLTEIFNKDLGYLDMGNFADVVRKNGLNNSHFMSESTLNHLLSLQDKFKATSKPEYYKEMEDFISAYSLSLDTFLREQLAKYKKELLKNKPIKTPNNLLMDKQLSSKSYSDLIGYISNRYSFINPFGRDILDKPELVRGRKIVNLRLPKKQSNIIPPIEPVTPTTPITPTELITSLPDIAKPVSDTVKANADISLSQTTKETLNSLTSLSKLIDKVSKPVEIDLSLNFDSYVGAFESLGELKNQGLSLLNALATPIDLDFSTLDVLSSTLDRISSQVGEVNSRFRQLDAITSNGLGFSKDDDTEVVGVLKNKFSNLDNILGSNIIDKDDVKRATDDITEYIENNMSKLTSKTAGDFLDALNSVSSLDLGGVSKEKFAQSVFNANDVNKLTEAFKTLKSALDANMFDGLDGASEVLRDLDSLDTSYLSEISDIFNRLDTTDLNRLIGSINKEYLKVAYNSPDIEFYNDRTIKDIRNELKQLEADKKLLSKGIRKVSKDSYFVENLNSVFGLDLNLDNLGGLYTSGGVLNAKVSKAIAEKVESFGLEADDIEANIERYGWLNEKLLQSIADKGVTDLTSYVNENKDAIKKQSLRDYLTNKIESNKEELEQARVGTDTVARAYLESLTLLIDRIQDIKDNRNVNELKGLIGEIDALNDYDFDIDLPDFSSDKSKITALADKQFAQMNDIATAVGQSRAKIDALKMRGSSVNVSSIASIGGVSDVVNDLVEVSGLLKQLDFSTVGVLANYLGDVKSNNTLPKLIKDIGDLSRSLDGLKLNKLKDLNNIDIPDITSKLSKLNGVGLNIDVSGLITIGKAVRGLSTNLQYLSKKSDELDFSSVGRQISALDGMGLDTDVSGLLNIGKAVRGLSTNLQYLSKKSDELDFSSVGRQISKLRDVGENADISDITNVGKSIRGLSTNLQFFAKKSDMIDKGVDNLSSAFQKIKGSADGLDVASDTLNKLSSSIKEIVKSSKYLSKISKAIDNIGKESKSTSKSVKSVDKGIKNINKSSKKANKELKEMNQRFEGLGHNVGVISNLLNRGLSLYLFREIAQAMGRAVELSGDFDKSMTMVRETFGGSASEVQEFAKQMNQSFFVNPNDVRKSLSTLGNLFKNAGMDINQALDMSKVLTMISYDIGSAFGRSSQEAIQDIRSAIVGQTEAIQKYGVQVEESYVQQVLMNEGLEINMQKLSNVEKMQARYVAILAQTSSQQGFMAKMLDTTTGKFEAMKESITYLVSNVSLIMKHFFADVVTSGLKAVTFANRVTERLIEMLGIQAETAPTDAMDSTTEALNNVEDAAKSAKNSVASFDEVISLTGSSGGLASGSGLSKELQELAKKYEKGFSFGSSGFEFDQAQIDNVANKIFKGVSWIKDNFDSILKTVGLIGAGIIGWKVSSGLLSAFNLIGGLTKGGSISGLLSVSSEGLLKFFSTGLGSKIISGLGTLALFGGMLKDMDDRFGALDVIKDLLSDISYALGDNNILQKLNVSLDSPISTLNQYLDALGLGQNDLIMLIGGLSTGLPGTIAFVGYELQKFTANFTNLMGSFMTSNNEGLSHKTSKSAEEKLNLIESDVNSLSETLAKLGLGLDIPTDELSNSLDKSFNNIYSVIEGVAKDKRDKELEKLSYIKDHLGVEKYNQLVSELETEYQKTITTISNNEAIITDIIAKAKQEQRTITHDEYELILGHYREYQKGIVDYASATSSDVSQIEQNLARNTAYWSEQAYVNSVNDAKNKKDELILSAQERYNKEVEINRQLFAEGKLTREEYDKNVKKAQESKDATIKASEDAYEGMRNTIREKSPEIASALEDENGKLRTGWDNFWLGCRNFFNEQFAQPIKDTLISLTAGFQDAYVPNWLKDNKGFDINLVSAVDGDGNTDILTYNKVPKYARGGVVTKAHLGVVGEAGAEAIVPLERSDFIEKFASNIASKVGNSSNQPQVVNNITIKLDSTFDDDFTLREKARKLMQYIDEENQRRGVSYGY